MTTAWDGYPRLSDNTAAEVYRAAGMEPPWTRVWLDGEDVTDRPELWPWPWAGERPAGATRRGRGRRHG